MVAGRDLKARPGQQANLSRGLITILEVPWVISIAFWSHTTAWHDDWFFSCMCNGIAPILDDREWPWIGLKYYIWPNSKSKKSTSAFRIDSSQSEIFYLKIMQNLGAQLQVLTKLWGFPDSDQIGGDVHPPQSSLLASSGFKTTPPTPVKKTFFCKKSFLSFRADIFVCGKSIPLVFGMVLLFFHIWVFLCFWCS